MLVNFIWIFGIIGFMVALFNQLEEYGCNFEIEEFGFSVVIGIFTAMVSAVAVFVISVIISANANTEYVQTYQSQIYENASKSYCVMENGTGKYKVYIDEASTNVVRVDKSKTELIDDGGASLEGYEKVYSNETVKKFIGNAFVGDTKWEIHIPKNSITTEKTENK